MSLLADIAIGAATLDPTRRSLGAGDGRGASMPASRRSIANDDVLVLTDRRTGVVAVLHRWADRIRTEKPLPPPVMQIVSTRSRLWSVVPPATISSELAVLDEHWAWALQQAWAEEMVADLEDLRDKILSAAGVMVHLVPCPVCGILTRLDEFVTIHRDCLLA